MDRLTPQQRHYNMAAIQGRDTKPEMVVLKYRAHLPKLFPIAPGDEAVEPSDVANSDKEVEHCSES